MITEFGLTDGPFDTKYAPLAAFGVRLWQDGTLKHFAKVVEDGFTPSNKLIQVLSSILAGCEYVCEVNGRLMSETGLARAWGTVRYLERSSLDLGLNRLSPSLTS